MATLILHYYEDESKASKLVQGAVKYGLDLLNCAPLFNPKAESEAAKTKRTKNDIRVLVIRAFATCPELDHFLASDWLVGYFQELLTTPHRSGLPSTFTNYESCMNRSLVQPKGGAV